VRRRLGAHHHGADAEQHEAAGRHQQRPERLRQPDQQRRGAESGAQRCGQGPGTAERDGALEPDQRAEEAADHQRAVQQGEIGLGSRRAPAEAQDPGPQAGEEGQHAHRHQREAP
jgi:hypothetical protein